MDGNETKFYSNSIFSDNAPGIGDGLKRIGWDKKTFGQLKSKLAAINARTIVLNRSGDSGVPWAEITCRYVEHFTDSYQFYAPDSPKLAKLHAKGCSKNFKATAWCFYSKAQRPAHIERFAMAMTIIRAF